MNRAIAPNINSINHLNTGFPNSDKNIFKIPSEEGVFKLEIVFPQAGYGTIDNKFLGVFGTDLLLSGTIDTTAQQIAGQIDELGGYVFKGADYYAASVTLFGLNENSSELLSIVKNSIDHCYYNEKELGIYKKKRLSELKINLQKTAYLANRQLNQLLFGPNHPFANSMTESAISNISQAELINFKNTHICNPYFIFTGSQNHNIESILTEYGYQLGAYETINRSDIQPHSQKLDRHIQLNGSTQNSIRMGKIIPSREHPDFFSISLLNLILGGYFGSRLMKNIREEKGLTYGIHSSITPFRGFSLFKISCECNNKLSDTVLNEIRLEIDSLKNKLIDIEELTIAKNYLSGALLRNFDGAFNISERFKSFLELQTSHKYYDIFFKAINRISPEEIMACANNYLDFNTLEYCIVGEI